MTNRNDDSEAESRRILSRAALESDPALAPRGFRPAGAAESGGEADSIELWGVRVARILALIITAGLLLWLVAVLLGD